MTRPLISKVMSSNVLCFLWPGPEPELVTKPLYGFLVLCVGLCLVPGQSSFSAARNLKGTNHQVSFTGSAAELPTGTETIYLASFFMYTTCCSFGVLCPPFDLLLSSILNEVHN